jgi:TonB family protein
MLWLLILAAAASDAPAIETPATAAPTETPSATHPPTCEDCTPPKIVSQPRPSYPTAAAIERIEGMVVVEMIVSETGVPEKVRVVESLPALDAAAVENARTWRFKPGQKAGTPVSAVVYGEIKFRLIDDDRISRSMIGTPKRSGDPVPKLLKSLRHKKVAVREQAALQLAVAPDAGPQARLALLAALDDSELSVRDRAAVALFAINDPADDALFAPDVVPSFVSRRPPRYPDGSDKTVKGRVELKLLVSESGRVLNASYDRRLAPELDTMALHTASYWRYEPRMKDGRPRPFVVPAVFSFEGNYVALPSP